jgi:hypothetical protein
MESQQVRARPGSGLGPQCASRLESAVVADVGQDGGQSLAEHLAADAPEQPRHERSLDAVELDVFPGQPGAARDFPRMLVTTVGWSVSLLRQSAQWLDRPATRLHDRDQASLKGCGVPAVIASRQDCAMFAGGPFLGCAGGPLP